MRRAMHGVRAPLMRGRDHRQRPVDPLAQRGRLRVSLLEFTPTVCVKTLTSAQYPVRSRLQLCAAVSILVEHLTAPTAQLSTYGFQQRN